MSVVVLFSQLCAVLGSTIDYRAHGSTIWVTDYISPLGTENYNLLLTGETPGKLEVMCLFNSADDALYMHNMRERGGGGSCIIVYIVVCIIPQMLIMKHCVT